MGIEDTHPWIRFQVDLRHAGAELWILLGEAASKCEHLSKELPSPQHDNAI